MDSPIRPRRLCTRTREMIRVLREASRQRKARVTELQAQRRSNAAHHAARCTLGC